jgi:hypothetical protein
MKKLFLYIILSISISSCKDKKYFRPVDGFEIVENGLEAYERVRVLYYTHGPYDDQVDKGFYRHAVVQSTITNDTFNVLTFPNTDLDNLTMANNILVYNDRPDIRKSIKNFEGLSEDMKKKIDNIDTTKVSWPKYSIVARDPEFDFIAVNEFKTVIGSLTIK